MKIFLDDERYPASGWYHILRDYNEFVLFITEHGMPNFVSFDHDLGDGKNGFDCTKWLVDQHLDGNKLPRDFDWYVHSMNPIGAKNIQSYLKRFKENFQEDFD